MNVIENQAGERRTQDAGDGNAGKQDGDSTRLLLLRKPVSEIEQHAGEIPGFGDTEQEADGQQLVNVVDEASEAGEKPPGEEDAGDPDTRADFVKQEIAGNFKSGIAEEEDAGDQAELLAGDGEFAIHGEGGEPDVDAVEERDNVEEKDEGENADVEFAESTGFEGGRQVGETLGEERGVVKGRVGDRKEAGA